MDNPAEPTNEMLSLGDRMYGSDNAESETTTGEAEEVQDQAESTDADESEDSAESTDGDTDGEESSEETDATDGDEVFVITTKDGEQEVKLSELRNGYLRQSDYTKKTTALAEERKAIEAAKAETTQRLQLLKGIESELAQMALGDFANVDWATIRDTDPSQYLALKEAKESREKVIAEAQQKLKQVNDRLAQNEGAQLHESLGWSDANKRTTDISQIESYIKDAGIPADVFAQVTNHKLMTAILEAAKYRALQAKKPEIVRKVKQAPKAIGKPVKAAEQAPLSMADRMYRKKSN